MVFSRLTRANDPPGAFIEDPGTYLVLNRASGQWMLGYAGSLAVPFEPGHLGVSASNGRLYHPGPFGSCLVSSNLALQISGGEDMEYDAERKQYRLVFHGATFWLPETPK